MAYKSDDKAPKRWIDQILSTLSEAVIVIDDRLRIISVNDSASLLFEKNRSLLLGMYIWEVLPLHQDEVLLEEPYYRFAFEQQDFSSLTRAHVVHLGGKLMLINLTVQFLKDFKQVVFVMEDDKRIQLKLERHERRQAEIARNKINSILESINDAFFALDKKWQFTYINQQADPFFVGKSKFDMIGKNIWEEFPSLVSTQLFRVAQQAIESGKTRTFQEYHPHADAWLEFRLYSSRDGLSVYFRDITASKIAEERTFVQYEITRILSQSGDKEETVEAILNVIGENLHFNFCGFWLPDKNGELILALKWLNDQRLEKISNITSLRKGIGILGKVWQTKESMWIDSARDWGSWLRIKAAKEAHLNTAFAVPVRGNGEILGVLEFMMLDHKDPDRQLLSYLGSLGNQIGQFLQRKEAEREARVSEEKFRLLVSGAQDYVMMMLDAKGKVVSWNEGGERLLGYKQEEAIGKNFSLFFSKKDRRERRPQQEIDRAIEKGKSLDESYLVRKDGSKFWASGTTTALWDNLKLRGLVKIAKDETQRRQLEARKDEFISLASHELKTPVTSVKVFTQILQKRLKDYPDGEIIRFLGKMDTQLDKLTKLISDLLNLSKIQVGKLEFQWDDVDLDDLIADTVENLQATATKHKINLHGKIGQSIKGDRDRIGQVIINLLTNAMKYSQESDKVDILVAKQGNLVSVSVTDFGIGIAKKDQKKIFNRFFQAHDHPKSFPGLGIGLYISREIARRHGGEIYVESEKGKGSKFTLVLPFS